MDLTALEVINESRVYTLGKIAEGQAALAREELEHAFRYYLQAAQGIVRGLRDARDILTSSAEYLAPGEENRYALLQQINLYLKGKRIYPLLEEIINALDESRCRWQGRVEEIKGLQSQPLAQQHVDHIPSLLSELRRWRCSITRCDETGVGYDALLVLRGQLAEGVPPEKLRETVRDHKQRDLEEFAKIDSIISELSTTATKLAAATRKQ